MTEAIIRTENLCKHFGKLEVLRGITTEIRRGEVVVLRLRQFAEGDFTHHFTS